MSATRKMMKEETDIYYDHHSQVFLIPCKKGDFIKCGVPILKTILKDACYSDEKGDDDILSPMEEQIKWIVENRHVEFVGAVAGYRRGFQEVNGVNLLINKELRLIKPVEGEWSNLRYFFESLLLDENEEQLHYFYGWLKVALEGLYNADLRRPGQALCIAGPVKCGKTLCQRILTELLGGAEAHPYQYLVGETSFNSDLFHACHLRIDDENRYTGHEARKNFGNFLKNSLYGRSVRCHGKGRVPVALQPHWRLTIAINDNEENLLVLPEIKSDMEDKIILLKANVVRFSFIDSEDPNSQANYWRSLEAEFPAFVHYLLNTWKIEKDYRDARSGVKGYQNPELMETVDSYTKEAFLMEMVDAVLWKDDSLPGLFGKYTDGLRWEGTADELRAILIEKVGHDAEKMLSWRNATGTLLNNAMRMNDYKNRVEYRKTKTVRKWTIFNKDYQPSKNEKNHEQNPF